jgi:hypothetical protein
VKFRLIELPQLLFHGGDGEEENGGAQQDDGCGHPGPAAAAQIFMANGNDHYANLLSTVARALLGHRLRDAGAGRRPEWRKPEQAQPAVYSIVMRTKR